MSGIPYKTPLAVLAAVAALGAGCGGGAGDSLTIYSGREEEIVAPLLERFEQASGVDVEVRYGESAELAATILEEGERSPADVFFAQDAGSLGAVAEAGRLAELPSRTLERVARAYRDPGGRWVGTSGRVRVVAYNTDALSAEELPDSILDFVHPRWKGKIGLPPTNASFQAFVTAMRLSLGEQRTRAWLDGIKTNRPTFYEKNGSVLEALASGEIEVGFVNHYYLYLLREEQPDAPVANHFLKRGDPGALVNVAGVGIVDGTEDPGDAERFVEYLLSDEGQRFYSEEAEEAEYPLVAGIEPRDDLPPLAGLEGPRVGLGELGAELERTLELLSEAGYTA
ncbi:MAG: iron ABC transporter substrate-binding protein [Gaiellaceae bacterium]